MLKLSLSVLYDDGNSTSPSCVLAADECFLHSLWTSFPFPNSPTVGTPLLLTLPTIMFKVVSVLDSRMPIKKIQVGQVWKKEDSGDSYLVTKIYNEALATFAVLRKAGSETDAPLRVKVGHKGASPNLPGFRFAQESEEF